MPAAILADAVTLLSNNWSDYDLVPTIRTTAAPVATPRPTTGYRFAVVAGKGPSFTWPTARRRRTSCSAPTAASATSCACSRTGTSAACAINYRGSIVSLFNSRQAIGRSSTAPNVYDYGDRNFTFDTDFLMPALLPPGTPMFRDVNTLTFRQI